MRGLDLQLLFAVQLRRSLILFPLNRKDTPMIETIAVVLLLLWGLGLVTSFSMGGFIHILLVAAIVLVLVRVIQGRKIIG